MSRLIILDVFKYKIYKILKHDFFIKIATLQMDIDFLNNEQHCDETLKEGEER